MPATYWAPDGINQFGEKSFAAPIEILTRWEEIAEEFVTPEGEERISQAKLMVDRDLEYGAYLKLGEVDGSTPASPIGVDEAWPIQLIKDTPNIRNTRVLREVML